METAKINIVLDELAQRRDEIVDFPVDDPGSYQYPSRSKDFIQRVSEFVFFVRQTPELWDTFEKLLYLPIRRSNSKEWKELTGEADLICVRIGDELKKAVTSFGLKASREYSNPRWLNPFGDGPPGSLSTQDLIEKFSNHGKPLASLEQVETVLSILHGHYNTGIDSIFECFEKSPGLVCRNVQPQLDSLARIHEHLRTIGVYEPDYLGHQEAKALMRLHVVGYPDSSLAEQFVHDFLDAFVLNKNLPKQKLDKEMILEAKQAARKISRILSRSLTLTKSKRYTITRLKVYLEWLFTSAAKSKGPTEDSLVDQAAKFLYLQGLFPFIRLNLARKEPDLYIDVARGDEIVLEAKYRRKDQNVTSHQIDDYISQAVEYHSLLKTSHPEFSNEVFLVIFHQNAGRPSVRSPIMASGVSVVTEFVYVGNKTPSKRGAIRDVTPEQYVGN
jgi:hypothetical protein